MGSPRILLPVSEGSSTDQDDSDALLVARARHGDAHAFALLYHRYVDRVYDFAARRLESVEAAEDATQTIFLRAVVSIGQCREDGLFAGWLFAIARNVITDSYRSRPAAATALDESAELRDPGSTPEEDAIRAEWNRELTELRRKCLNEREREILDLRLQELNDKEISIALGRSHGAIRVAQHRLILKLRRCMGLVSKEVTHVAR